MRKVTDFIINKRYFILAIFIIFTIISVILSAKVKINYDIAEYLPDTSETRIGMNIMEKEFAGTETSNLNLMFENLSDDKKIEVKDYLENIEGVEEVEYDNTEEYNKNQYTLYVITVDDKSDSQLATNVYDQVTEEYGDYKIYTSGNVSETNKPVLPIWIIALAIACALVILIIMCESYVEPFLFLTSILMAVLLNKGTNIIFGTVSNITNSIAAILQLALSMDYSIMLMNRYEQEKQKTKNNIDAMKNALYNAFQAISSSSVTTIVGLLALVFMTFKIGKDLGFVLAKGVLFSLICIFFVLPALILMFDKWIAKTKKKTPNIKLDSLGKFSYKMRFVAVPLFLIVFITSFVLKGNLGIDYTDSEQDEISKVFSENNQMAIIYKNDEEGQISQYLKQLENEGKVDEVLAYGNTIGEKLPYNELNDRLNELDPDADIEIEDYLLKILYYEYYNPNSEDKLTFDEFVSFIEEEAYNNEKINKDIDAETKNGIARLKNFITEDSMNKKRTAGEIASILEIDKEKVDDILIYYLSKNDDIQITLSDFINFMNNEVVKDKKYSSQINDSMKSDLKTLSKFSNKKLMQKKLTSSEMSEVFGIDTSTINELYKYYISVNDIDTKITISEFSNFVLNNVLTNSAYANSFDEETVQSIKLLANFSNVNIITKQMNSTQLSNLFGLDEEKVTYILFLKYSQLDSQKTLTIPEFATKVIGIKENTPFLGDMDVSDLKNLVYMQDATPYTASQLSQILGMNLSQVRKLYALIDLVAKDTDSWVASPNEFVSLILNNSSDGMINGSIDESKMNQLKLLSIVMSSSINKVSYSYNELANVIGIDTGVTKSIYTLYVSENNSTKMTPQEFVNFVLEHKNDEQLSGRLSSDMINNLNLIKKVINAVVSNEKYSSSEISNLLGINSEDLKLIFGLYNTRYINKNPTISLKDFVQFLLDDVVTNSEYAGNFDEEQISRLNTVNGIMDNSLKGTRYTADEIFAIASNLTDGVDKNIVEVLYTYYGSSEKYDDSWQLTVEEFINFLNDKILQDERYEDFIEDDMREDIVNAKDKIKDAKELLVGENYSRIILNTKFNPEGNETFEFVQKIKDMLNGNIDEFYVIGDSPMAYEMSKTFDNELNLMTIITMVSIFVVVAITFKSGIIPIILVLTIQCAVYLIMGILSFTGENVYFIAILIVQSILMGATIDYAILYTSYYLEYRKTKSIKESVIEAYNNSIHTILTSSSILIIVTLIIANFASAIAAKICKTISEGTLCSTILILFLLPAVLAFWDRFINKKKIKN